MNKPRIKRFCATTLSVILIIMLIFPQGVYARSVENLPAPGTMIAPSNSFTPITVSGITIFPDNPLQFDFIIDTGDDNLKGEELRKESKKLINYFLATLTVPEDEMWVNLSPYEKDRIVANGLGITEMGRDMLAQDYILKQLAASLMYPEDDAGSEFWKRVYSKTKAKFGTTEIPANTFNKIWIVPDKATVYINGNSVFVSESRLKVMLEEDYLAMESNKDSTKHGLGEMTKDDIEVISEEAKEAIREILIPEIEREVNEGKNFANLRQIFNSMVLASWYKKNLEESVLGKIYANSNKTDGIALENKNVKEEIYNKYVEAFKKGVFNYIKEDYDEATQQIIPRKYFSGGEDFEALYVEGLRNEDAAMLIKKRFADEGVEYRERVELEMIDASGEVVDAGQTTDSDFSMLATPEWPKTNPVNQTQVDTVIRVSIPELKDILAKISVEKNAAGVETLSPVKQALLATAIRNFTGEDVELFNAARTYATGKHGQMQEGWSSTQWISYARAMFFYLNQTTFIPNGWIVDIGVEPDHIMGGQFLRPIRGKVEKYDFVDDEGEIVILAEVGEVAPEKADGNSLIVGARALFRNPGYVLFNSEDDEVLDEQYDGTVNFSKDSPSIGEFPTLGQIFDRLSSISKEEYRAIQRKLALQEEWGHYNQFKARDKIERSQEEKVFVDQHIDILFPEDTKSKMEKAMREHLLGQAAQWGSNEHAAHALMMIAYETKEMLIKLFTASSENEFLVSLIEVVMATQAQDNEHIYSSRLILNAVEEFLESDEIRTPDSKKVSVQEAFPQIVAITTKDLWKKLKSADNAILTHGGIDFNSNMLNFDAKGQSINIKIDNSMFQSIQPNTVQGIIPVIINIKPIINYMPLLGMPDTNKLDNQRVSLLQ